MAHTRTHSYCWAFCLSFACMLTWFVPVEALFSAPAPRPAASVGWSFFGLWFVTVAHAAACAAGYAFGVKACIAALAIGVTAALAAYHAAVKSAEAT